MPTTIFRGARANLTPLGLALPPSYRPDDVLIGPWSRNAIGPELTGMGASNFASAAWPVACGIGFPFEISDYFLVLKGWRANGATAGTDQTVVSVFPEAAGVSSAVYLGTTPTVTGTNQIQEMDGTDALLRPGRYWCVCVQNGTTATALASATPVALLRAAGCAQDTGAGQDSFTPSVITSAYMPLFGIAGRTQVA